MHSYCSKYGEFVRRVPILRKQDRKKCGEAHDKGEKEEKGVLGETDGLDYGKSNVNFFTTIQFSFYMYCERTLWRLEITWRRPFMEQFQ